MGCWCQSTSLTFQFRVLGSGIHATDRIVQRNTLYIIVFFVVLLCIPMCYSIALCVPVPYTLTQYTVPIFIHCYYFIHTVKSHCGHSMDTWKQGMKCFSNYEFARISIKMQDATGKRIYSLRRVPYNIVVARIVSNSNCGEWRIPHAETNHCLEMQKY